MSRQGLNSDRYDNQVNIKNYRYNGQKELEMNSPTNVERKNVEE